ncbi:MAG TPA: response regulator [Phycisphaerales bacterium]|nr:response regulator [Phycisphaerales bacterium]
MEPLDQEIAKVLMDERPSLGPARVLVVGPATVERVMMTRCVEHQRHGRACVESVDEARTTLARKRFDLALIDASVEGCQELISHVGRVTPTTRVLVYSSQKAFDTAVEAMRRGAVDYVTLPATEEEIRRRIESALGKSRAEQQREERLARLKSICKELNTVRHEIAEQVDSLCQDLVTAYQDVNDQLSEVAMATEFRTLLKQELDVEDLLRTSLEYLLQKTGPTNAAIFLPDSNGRYALGAYVNYDCPRDTVTVLLDHLCEAVCPQMADEHEIVSFEDSADFAEWIGEEAEILTDSQVIAYSCQHEGACLAVIVLFRKNTEPFDEKLGQVIGTLRPIFAAQLNQIIKVHHRAKPSWPKDIHGEEDEGEDFDDFGFGAAGGMAA